MNAETHPASIALQKFKEDVAAASNNTIIIDLYGNSVIGGENEVEQMVEDGSMDASLLMGMGYWQGMDPRVAVDEMPFLFSSKENARNAYDGEFGEMLKGIIHECSLNGLGCVVRGGFLRSLSACAQGQDHHECEYKCQNFFHFSCVSFLIFCDWYCGMIFIPLELNFTRYSWICQYLFRTFRHFMYHAQFSPTNTVKKQQFTFCCLLLNLDIPISTMYIDFIFV